MLNTKQALADSLMKLLNHRTLDRITVSDITNDCGLNRQTFYYHFHDVYDLLEWIIKSKYDNGLTKNAPSLDSWKSLTTDIYHNLLKQKSFYLNVYHSLPNYVIRSFLKDISNPLIGNYIDYHLKNRELSDVDRKFLIDFFTGVLSNFLLGWFDEGMPEREDNEMDRFFYLLDGMAEWVLDRLIQYDA